MLTNFERTVCPEFSHLLVLTVYQTLSQALGMCPQIKQRPLPSHISQLMEDVGEKQ